jgi:hypothetical protein
VDLLFDFGGDAQIIAADSALLSLDSRSLIGSSTNSAVGPFSFSCKIQSDAGLNCSILDNREENVIATFEPATTLVSPPSLQSNSQVRQVFQGVVVSADPGVNNEPFVLTMQTSDNSGGLSTIVELMSPTVLYIQDVGIFLDNLINLQLGGCNGSTSPATYDQSTTSFVACGVSAASAGNIPVTFNCTNGLNFDNKSTVKGMPYSFDCLFTDRATYNIHFQGNY